MLIFEGLISSNLEKNRIQALLAAPSTGGEVNRIFKALLYIFLVMSAEFNYNSENKNIDQGRVKVTDLMFRLNQEKKIEKFAY